MEMMRSSGRLCDCGRVVIFWHISYPSGISDEADEYYQNAAQAFEKSCRDDLFRLAAEDRKLGRRGLWRADFKCNDRVENDSIAIDLEISINRGREKLLTKSFCEIWEMTV